MSCYPKCFLPLILLLVVFSTFAQRPQYVHWDYRYGGETHDDFTQIYRLRDGGFVLSGMTSSGISGNKTTLTWGGGDYWIIRLDSLGNKLWEKTYGGTGGEISWCMAPANDGGFLLGGHSGSGVNGDKTEPGRGGSDYWVVKLDSFGNKQWDKTFGGNSHESLYDVVTCRDGGFVLIGNSTSGASGDKSEDNAGPDECGWVVKIDSLGNKEWDQTFKNGGTARVRLRCGIEDMDGGLLFFGETGEGAQNDISEGGYGGTDYWVVKTDPSGNIAWDKRYGGTGGEGIEFVTLTNDSNIVMVGESASSNTGIKTEPRLGYWLVKIDGMGQVIWQEVVFSLGYLTAIKPTNDNGIILSAYTSASGAIDDKSEANLGWLQTWMVKISQSGVKEWDKTIFTLDKNGGIAMEVDIGCYVIGAAANGNPGGYKSQPNWDTSLVSNDFWILKLCDQPVAVQEPNGNLDIKVYPNPISSYLYIDTPTPGSIISLYNILGGEALTQPLTQTHTKLDVSTLPAGVYVYRITQNGQAVYGKVVVE